VLLFPVQSEIITDHNNIKDLFKMYSEASDYERKSIIVNTVIREIAVHSEAEEITVYNSTGLTEEDSKSLRNEHQELEEILYSLDYTKLSSPEFGPKFKSALKHFIQHSDHEERGNEGYDSGSLTALAQKLSGEDNHKLAAEFVGARKAVPTRPHPMAPQNGGLLQKILGMGTKIPHDKIVETLQGKRFIPIEELRFQHPATGKVQPVILDSKLFD